MAWVPFAAAPGGGVAATLMTHNNPAPATVPAANRSWVPAVNPYSTGRAMAPFIGPELAFRGDTRTPATIDLAGGLWAYQAQAVGTGGVAAQRDPHTHQAGPGNTIYVSFSRDLGVAKGFAFGGYVYLVRINAGVDYNSYAGGNAMQAEVMAVQGVRLQDILAVRNMATNQILVNTNFQQAGMQPAVYQNAIQALAG